MNPVLAKDIAVKLLGSFVLQTAKIRRELAKSFSQTAMARNFSAPFAPRSKKVNGQKLGRKEAESPKSKRPD
jgi:hypothetical protein